MTAGDRLSAALWEADRHAAALDEALADWAPRAGTRLDEIERDRALVRLLDQLLFRFTKLQDTLGERLVPATLASLAEPYDDWPMRDRLNRLEISASSTWETGCAGARRATAWRTSTRTRRPCGWRRCTPASPPPPNCGRPTPPGGSASSPRRERRRGVDRRHPDRLPA